MISVEVRRGHWADSARMMRAARGAQEAEGVETALVFMATPANVAEAAERGISHPDLDGAGPGDLVIAASGADPEAGLAAAGGVLAAGTKEGGAGAAEEAVPRSLVRTEADLAVISVPGEYATLETHKALGAGMDVLLFSDGVSPRDERRLKERARAMGRLVMGPGAGTAIIDGVGLGFANVVSPGPVGVVAGAGTGAQAVSVLLDQLGTGVRQLYGIGGHDMHADVGSLSALTAIERLAADPETTAILCVSKPPAPSEAELVVSVLERCGRPAVACFVGAEDRPDDPVPVFGTLAAASEAAARLVGAEGRLAADPEVTAGAPCLVRGLFSGGTLCSEAAAILAAELGDVASNAPGGAAARLAPGASVAGHACLDLGEEEYTRGRPHPMIDPAARAELIAEHTGDPAVGVLLLDVVLGYASHVDPAGALVEPITAARAARPELTAVAHVLGTEADPQVLSAQVRTLTDLGVVLSATSAGAARLAARIAAGAR